MKTINPVERPALTASQMAQIEAARSREPDIDDIPPAPAENWAYAKRFFKPRKESISLRIDADVLDWLKHRHEKYQSEINRILRARMDAEIALDAQAGLR
jgi:uncharacterized protein (DUF4415 family)